MTGWRGWLTWHNLFSSGRKRLDPLYATKGAPVKNKSNAMDMKTEMELVDLAKQGDMQAFSALFDAHKARIYSLCLRLTGSRSEAEEFTEGAFLHVFRRLNCSEGRDFPAWIYRTATDMVLAQRRKARSGALSIDHLVKLADQSICPTRRPARFSRMRSSVRKARLHVSATRSWTSVMSTLGRAVRAIS
jgi:RNA polymerase sigma-70 factor, ECF subfamily